MCSMGSRKSHIGLVEWKLRGKDIPKWGLEQGLKLGRDYVIGFIHLQTVEFDWMEGGKEVKGTESGQKDEWRGKGAAEPAWTAAYGLFIPELETSPGDKSSGNDKLHCTVNSTYLPSNFSLQLPFYLTAELTSTGLSQMESPGLNLRLCF